MHLSDTNIGPKANLNISQAMPDTCSNKQPEAPIAGALTIRAFREWVGAIAVQAALTLAIVSALLLTTAGAAHAQTVVYNFCSQPNCTDGSNPLSSLTADDAGNLYGTTSSGGTSGLGTVFELSPNGSGGWNETVLYSFTSLTWSPVSQVIFDKAGNLYGTTLFTVFQLSPAGTSWTETTLLTFDYDTTVSVPVNGLIIDSAGNLYGTAQYSHHLNCAHRYGFAPSGAIFKLSPPLPGGQREFQEIYDFCPAGYIAYFGDTGTGGLTMDAAGNIFGVAFDLVFELSSDGNGGWNPTVIHSFPNRSESAYSAPVLDPAGNLYGTRWGGGKNPGSVYKLTPNPNGWQATTLYGFKGEPDGGDPVAGIVLDSGNIYGTTTAGGEFGDGTVFKLWAPVGKGRYKDKVWSFDGTDGFGSNDGGISLVMDKDGNLYGASEQGGLYGGGVVYEVTP